MPKFVLHLSLSTSFLYHFDVYFLNDTKVDSTSNEKNLGTCLNSDYEKICLKLFENNL